MCGWIRWPLPRLNSQGKPAPHAILFPSHQQRLFGPRTRGYQLSVVRPQGIRPISVRHSRRCSSPAARPFCARAHTFPSAPLSAHSPSTSTNAPVAYNTHWPRAGRRWPQVADVMRPHKSPRQRSPRRWRIRPVGITVWLRKMPSWVAPMRKMAP